MEFYFPTELGEQLAFCAAAVAAVIGFLMMFAPGYTFRLLGLQPRDGQTGAYAQGRAMGGIYLGMGLSAMMLAQPMIYLAFGASFALAAFGRILSLMSDKGNVLINLLLLVVEAVLAALPVLYFLGWI